MAGWIDVHAHLDMLETSPEETLKKMSELGVDRVFTIGTEPNDHPVVLEIAKKNYPKVVCTLGIHPHHGAEWSQQAGEFIENNLHHPEVVAIGEIGLDYFYKNSPIEAQKDCFRRHLELAARTGMPVEIHTRDAEADTVEILKEFRGKVKGLIHCFTGTHWLAHQCLDLGYNISFSGVVTFKNAEDLRKTCQSVPLDRLHVETDAPFLTPVPLRGQKNTPAFVVHTAQVVSELHRVSMEELRQRTNENARQLFPKLN